MSITNLLARGFDPMPAGGQANALMQVQQFKDAKLKNALLQAQMQDAQTARQMQMAELQRNALLKQERDGYLASLQPVSGISANAVSGITGPRPEALAVVGQRPKIDPAKAMRVGLSEEQIKFLASADTLGMPEVARTIEEAGQNGAPQTVQFDKFGRRVGGGIAKPVQMSMQDLGGTVQPVNPYTQASPLKRTQTPDSVASNAVQMRGQNMVDARAREAAERASSDGGKAPAGYRWKADGSLEAIPGGPADLKQGGAGAKVADANDAIALLNQAQPLLKGSTGSYGGAAIDALAQVFGAATPGSVNAQQLKAIEGALVAKMPKMSGPQSDKDVLLYRQMAAVIGDETVPYERKAAAVEQVRAIQERYAGMEPGASKPGAAPKKVATDADYNALPSGATFIAPDGTTRRKP